jgi:exopolyphosphatase/pppGpp-phosphohydrolase
MNREKQVRGRSALERLQFRVKQSDKDLIKTARRFKDNQNPSKEEINSYREYLNKQIEVLSKRYPNG